ncbi:MAG TPA: PIN domain nuclease [Candidatus Aminicenantes bacterium]|nr:PIN domain nuclease [Candidatus Aminicenantes bacterium]
MILADTSVLIEYLRNGNSPIAELFERVLNSEIPWGITPLVYQEVLQGSRDANEFNRLKRYFDTLPVFTLKNGLASYERAARLNIRCRKAGVTVRSSVDLLIAETAIEHDLFLFHHDADFNRMTTAVPELQIFTGLIGTSG